MSARIITEDEPKPLDVRCNNLTVDGEAKINNLVLEGNIVVSNDNPIIAVINDAANINRANLVLNGVDTISGSHSLKIQQTNSGKAIIENFGLDDIDVLTHGGRDINLTPGTVGRSNLSNPYLLTGGGGAGLNIRSILQLDAANRVVSTALTNGQLLIGSTGASPVAASITSGSSNLTVTPGAGTITLSPTSNPVYSSVTLNAGTPLSSYHSNLAWTPLVLIGGQYLGVVQTTSGFYTEVGTNVFISGSISVTNTGGRTGAITINGVPGAPTAGSVATCHLPCTYSNVAFSIGYNSLIARPEALGDLGLYFNASNGSAEVAADHNMFANPANVITFSGFYRVI